MLFNTYTYAVFLPLVWLLYQALPLRGRHLMLLVASYVFYCWEKPIYGTLLLASTILDYWVAIGIEKTERPGARLAWLMCSMCGNLGMLGVFKYGDFFMHNAVGIGRLLGFETAWEPMHIILPVGISFYTFQTMSYTIQVYRRQMEADHNFISFALYVSFFPQLVAGPIERATNLLRQLLVYQRVTAEDVVAGLTRIVFGLFRKMVLADRFAILVDMVYADPNYYSTVTVWAGAICFAGQIYFDFAGYSDIAIGSARLFGIRLTENFRRPLQAASIADFWNRWHMTLTGWLRDYLFMPLGGFRKGGRRALVNAWVVLLLCGLWHGARWNFVFWGGTQALMMTIYYVWRARKKAGKRSKPRRGADPLLMLSVAFTLFSQIVAGVFFRSPGLAAVGTMFRALAGRHGGADEPTQWYPWLYFGLFASFMIVEFLQEQFDLNDRIRRLHWSLRAVGMSLVVLATILFAVNNAAPYIYFQF